MTLREIECAAVLAGRGVLYAPRIPDLCGGDACDIDDDDDGDDQDDPPVNPRQMVPLEMAGRWIVWSADDLRIVGHGATIGEAREMGRISGDAGTVMQKVPRFWRFKAAQ